MGLKVSRLIVLKFWRCGRKFRIVFRPTVSVSSSRNLTIQGGLVGGWWYPYQAQTGLWQTWRYFKKTKPSRRGRGEFLEVGGGWGEQVRAARQNTTVQVIAKAAQIFNKESVVWLWLQESMHLRVLHLILKFLADQVRQLWRLVLEQEVQNMRLSASLSLTRKSRVWVKSTESQRILQ